MKAAARLGLLTTGVIWAGLALGAGGCSGRGEAGAQADWREVGGWLLEVRVPAGDALAQGQWEGRVSITGSWFGGAQVWRGRVSLPSGLTTTGDLEGAAAGSWDSGALQAVTWEGLTAQGYASMIGEVSLHAVTPGARWERATQRLTATSDATQGFVIAHEALAAALPALGGDWLGGARGARVILGQELNALLAQTPLRAIEASPLRVMLVAVDTQRVGLWVTWRAQASGGLWLAGALVEGVTVSAEGTLWLRRADGLPDAFTLDVSASGTAHEGGFDLPFDASATIGVAWTWTQAPIGPRP